MNAISNWMMALTLLSGATFAAQPPDVVTSDNNVNTAMGTDALHSLTDGFDNTASGHYALYANTSGDWNTADGSAALVFNSTGTYNTATGGEALYANTTGNYNTAYGFQAIVYNGTGSYNTGTGVFALRNFSSGSYNTASGAYALGSLLQSLGSASKNTAIGAFALANNTTGGTNTATGYNALSSDTTGNNNAAHGDSALLLNTTGYNNTAVGHNSMHYNTTGSSNIAVGYNAGYYLTNGSYNVDIASTGVAADYGTIRIGTSGQQSRTFVAGIYTTKLTGSAVYITSSGQLGTLASSERYKTAIAPMGSNTANLGQLRPVTFRLKTDANGTRQFGLIAEEVAKVYPELVTRDETGRIDGVRYDELAPMLLNEVQKQSAEIRDLKSQISDLKHLRQEMLSAVAQLNAKREVIARN